MAGMLSTFAEFERDIIRERVKAGIANAREKGKAHGRPQTAAKKKDEAKKLYKNGKGLNKDEDEILRSNVRLCFSNKILLTILTNGREGAKLPRKVIFCQ